MTKQWQGDYYLKSDGKMAEKEWIYDADYQGWYYYKVMVPMLILHGKGIII